MKNQRKTKLIAGAGPSAPNVAKVTATVEPETPATYMVPGEVAVALNTGRSQFIDGLIKNVRDGRAIDPAQVIGMLELIRDWTNDRYADARRNAIVRENLAASVSHMRELRVQVAELVGRISDTTTTAALVANRHGGGPLGPEDDLE